jgi:hypothetical protein
VFSFPSLLFTPELGFGHSKSQELINADTYGLLGEFFLVGLYISGAFFAFFSFWGFTQGSDSPPALGGQ